MTCARPLCRRRRDFGVHCRKCHRRWKIQQHNLMRVFRGFDGFLHTAFPAYDGTDLSGCLDALIESLNPTGEATP